MEYHVEYHFLVGTTLGTKLAENNPRSGYFYRSQSRPICGN